MNPQKSLTGSERRTATRTLKALLGLVCRIPADIPKSKIVSSNIDRIDPKKQVKEAGYPFDHIGTELMALHGKFELVSADVRVMKEEFTQKTAELSSKIEKETSTLSTKIDDTKNTLLENAGNLFDRKFYRITGIIIGAIPVLYAAGSFVEIFLGSRPWPVYRICSWPHDLGCLVFYDKKVIGQRSGFRVSLDMSAPKSRANKSRFNRRRTLVASRGGKT